MTSSEEAMLNTLKIIDGYTALSLYPAIGEATIKPKGNRAFINEGRGGKFHDISEKFYDDMVDRFDSRYKKKKQ